MNVGEWPTRWAQRYPDETCLKYGDLTLTKKEFNRRINQAANAFQEMGLKKGDRVAVLMANGNGFLEILFAISKIGGLSLWCRVGNKRAGRIQTAPGLNNIERRRRLCLITSFLGSRSEKLNCPTESSCSP
jgi:non-ribosomal peptide synthetase component E (peptide arylation enzyme)